MTDDLSRVIGRLESGFEAIKEQNQDIKAHLTQQDQRTETNKKLAIDARQRLESKVDTIGRTTAEHAEWIKTHGVPMAQEWAQSRERKKIAAAEFRGRAMTWGKIGGGIVLVFTVLGYIGRDTWAAFLRKAANLLG